MATITAPADGLRSPRNTRLGEWRLHAELGNPIRFRIMKLLCRVPSMNVGALAEEIRDVKEPTVSKHLSRLVRAGLVLQYGRQYCACPEVIKALFADTLQDLQIA